MTGDNSNTGTSGSPDITGGDQFGNTGSGSPPITGGSDYVSPIDSGSPPITSFPATGGNTGGANDDPANHVGEYWDAYNNAWMPDQ